MNTNTALIPIRYCWECRRPTSGSIGAAGYFWPSLCQPCKDDADGILRTVIKQQAHMAQLVDAVLNPVPLISEVSQ